MEDTHQEARRFDILIPVQIFPNFGFHGSSGRSSSFNNEIAFTIFGWPASIHETQNKWRYIVVRTNATDPEARQAIQRVIDALPFVSICLDAGIRPVSDEIGVGDYDANIAINTIFTAGLNPRVYGGEGTTQVQAPAQDLTSAFAKSETLSRDTLKAAEVFADVDFEASRTSRLTLLNTTLELLCPKQSRDKATIALIDAWIDEAQTKGLTGLVNGLKNLKQEPMRAAIEASITSSCDAASLSAEVCDQMIRRTIKLYGLRNSVVHAGHEPKSEEIRDLRRIVRFLLTGQVWLGAFSDIRESDLF